MAASSQGLLTGIIINIVVFIILFLIFCWLRINDKSVKYFSPKYNTPHLKHKPLPLPKSFFGWIWPLITYPEPKIIETSGLDAAIYLRVLSFGCELFLWVSLWCLTAMLPVNLTDNYIDILLYSSDSNSSSSNLDFTSFDKCGLANVQLGSNRLWVHMISAYYITLVTLWLLYRYSKESVILRIMFIANSPPGRTSHTVLVTDIPAVKNDTMSRIKSIKSQRKMSRKVTDDMIQAQKSKSVLGPRPPLALVGGTEEESYVSPSDVQLHEAVVETEQSPPAEVKHSPPTDEQQTPPADVQQSLPNEHGGPDVPNIASAKEPAGSDPASEPIVPPVPPPAPPLAPPPAPPPSDPTPAESYESPFASPPEKRESGLVSFFKSFKKSKTAPSGPTGPRVRMRFTYDVKDTALDPVILAEELVQGGLSAKGMVEQEFKSVYTGDAIESVEMVKDLGELLPFVEEYNSMKLDLEDYLDELENRISKGLKVKRKKVLVIVPLLGEWGKKMYGGIIKRVDAFEHYIARLTELDRLISTEQPLTQQMNWPTAFITFKTRRDQAVAAMSLHHHDTAWWITQAAPEPEDLIWANLGKTLPTRSSTWSIMYIIFAIMTLFFMIPVGAVQGMIQLPMLASIPILAPFVANPVISKLLESIIPGLVLKIFLILVPPILRIMIKVAGAVSVSEIDFGIATLYFVFQVVVVFLGTVIMGSFFSQISEWINNIQSIVTTLGTAIPMVCTFFITYITLNGLNAKPIAFLRLPGYVIFLILTKFNGSPKARDRLWQEQYSAGPQSNGQAVVDHMVTILLGLVYACINPIICPIALTYFAANFVMERYQNIYVWKRSYESAGKLWPKVFNQVLAILYIMQLTMIGLLGIKKFSFIPLLIPAILITVIFHISCLKLFSRPWNLMALHDAGYLDEMESEGLLVPEAASSSEADKDDGEAVKAEQGGAIGPALVPPTSHYMSPLLKIVPGAIDALLEDAATMAARIDVLVKEAKAEKEAKKGRK